jgi:hypothetical protein
VVAIIMDQHPSCAGSGLALPVGANTYPHFPEAISL